MSFAELKSQMGQLSHDEMVRALAFLKSRLRVDNPTNREELSRRHAEMDAGRKVKWEDLKQELGMTGAVGL